MESITWQSHQEYNKNELQKRENPKFMEEKSVVVQNPLANGKISKLLIQFAVPSIVGMLVSALYNIIDQIFIGKGVGLLGNAATNVAFPLTTICTAIALLVGIGGASNFNLELGKGNQEKARCILGNAIFIMAFCGILLFVAVQIFLEPLIHFLGASEEVSPYARTYIGITSMGMPFLIFANGSSNLIRADGSPIYAMLCMAVGAVLNGILDPIFIFILDLGIAGAAWATVISQVISFLIAFRYVTRFKAIQLERKYLKPNGACIRSIAALGAASSFNQLAMSIVQITMNNTLRYYGAMSVYGSNIPLACVGIISKVNIVLMAFIIGIAHGAQPVIGFNYGAGNYARSKSAYLHAITAAGIFSVIAFICFQLFPRQIISIFGEGDKLYFHFAERYFRIFMFFTFVNCIQPVTANFFTSIGKARKGIFMSLTRQFLFLLPLIVLFPIFFGIDGVMYAGPIADIVSVGLAIFFIRRELKQMNQSILDSAREF